MTERGMTVQYLIGIDVGTSGTKVLLTDTAGRIAASVTKEYALYQPQSGWAEQDPADWWQAACEGIREVLEKSGIRAAQVACIGLTGQMHGMVMLDQDDRVLRRAILWCDQRTEAECEQIISTVGHDRYIQIAANPPLTGFTCPKILWVKKHEPDIYRQCAHILLPKDYIRFCLTGNKASEVTDASGTGLLNVRERAWSQELFDALGIPAHWFGPLLESSEIAGQITEAAAAATGLQAGTPVIAGAGDNAAAAIGNGMVAPGDAFVSIGTSGVVYVCTDGCKIHPKGIVHSFCAAVPNQWYVMGVTQAAGLSLKWFRENFAECFAAPGVHPYDRMTELAAAVPPGAEGLTYLPYLMGERTPHLDPNARGAFIGLQYGHKKEHFVRAILEGVAFSLTDCVEAIREMGVDIPQLSACGGGSHSALWRQILADVTGIPLETIGQNEGPALGAAILAGVGAHIYPTMEDACKVFRKPGEQTLPGENVYQKPYQQYRALYPALKGRFTF